MLAPVRRVGKLITGIWSVGSNEENELVGTMDRAGFTEVASLYKMFISEGKTKHPIKSTQILSI